MRNAETDYTLRGTLAQHLDMTAPDPLARFDPLARWMQERSFAGLNPLVKSTEDAVGPRLRVQGAEGAEWEGVNFASSDSLNLSTHPRVRSAAMAAIQAWGVHAAGCPAQMGNTAATQALEARLADFTGYTTCTVFPHAWATAFGVLRALLRPQDHVLIDALAHPALQEGARAATGHVHAVAHLSNAAVERKLGVIRRAHPAAGIVVVSESTFAADAAQPDLAGLQAICHAHGARLVVDASMDLGVLGPSGRGAAEGQGMVGKPDVLIGGFCGVLASNGGFVCSNAPALDLGLRLTCGVLADSGALSPVNATIVHTALNIVDSPEGADLRARLLANSLRLRAGLTAAGFTVAGVAGAMVPVLLGTSDPARRLTRFVLDNGAIVNLTEGTTEGRNACVWRLMVMAGHEADDIDRMIALAARARLMVR